MTSATAFYKLQSPFLDDMLQGSGHNSNQCLFWGGLPIAPRSNSPASARCPPVQPSSDTSHPGVSQGERPQKEPALQTPELGQQPPELRGNRFLLCKPSICGSLCKPGCWPAAVPGLLQIQGQQGHRNVYRSCNALR